jgi:hypothetical protein
MSIINFFRSDKPESPTDLVFVYLGLIAGGLWVYCNIIQKEIIALAVMAGLLTALKAVKIGSDFQKKRKANCIESCDDTKGVPDVPANQQPQ